MMESLLKRIKLLDNRSKDEEIRLDLYSTLVPYILSVDVFKNNKDIKAFIESLKLKKEIKWYVYKSRTQLVARISREIQRADREMLLFNAKVLKQHALSSENTNNESAKKEIVDILNKYSRNR